MRPTDRGGASRHASQHDILADSSIHPLRELPCLLVRTDAHRPQVFHARHCDRLLDVRAGAGNLQVRGLLFCGLFFRGVLLCGPYLDNAATAFITLLTHLPLTFKILIDKTEFKLK
jgi:hypothetical protein